MDEIDKAVAELCLSVGLTREDTQRLRKFRRQSREVNLKPGTDLRAIVTACRLDLDPAAFARFEKMVGGHLLMAAYYSKAGYAIAEGREYPLAYLARLMMTAAESIYDPKPKPRKKGAK